MPALPTGFPATDAQDDFSRARRRQAIRRLGRRFERGGADIDVILPFDEVVAELGRTGERDLGLQLVELDSIVGTVDRGGEGTSTGAPLKGHERLFRERVPLGPAAQARVVLSDPWLYGQLAEGVEAWGFRAMQDRAELLSRVENAQLWFEEEFVPSLREATPTPQGFRGLARGRKRG